MNAARSLVAGLCCFLCGCVAGGAGGAGRAADATALYVVEAHDTLYSIAWRHDIDYRDLARWNAIGPDYRVSIGQVLRLRPDAPPAPLPPVPRARPPANLGAAPGGAVVAGRQSSDAPQAGWVWPTARTSTPQPVPGGGILLLGSLGQDVRAASAGHVVYTGSGLRGYGNLIIIKHGEMLLSSYAHNRDILVHEGDAVSAGQVIAHMGTGPHQISALYFEIRENGKPTDPLRYLTKAR